MSPSIQSATVISKAWSTFCERHHPSSFGFTEPKPDQRKRLTATQLEHARKEWTSQLEELVKNPDCRPFNWPSTESEIGQLRSLLKWTATEMWTSVAGVGYLRISAEEPRPRFDPGKTSWTTWGLEVFTHEQNTGRVHAREAQALEKEMQRKGEAEIGQTKEEKTAPKKEGKKMPKEEGTWPKKEGLKESPDDLKKFPITILSPHLFSLQPLSFQKIWDSDEKSQALREFAITKWRTLAKEFYAMAMEYGDNMLGALRRVHNESEAEKLITSQDAYHLKLASTIYSDWGQAILRWSGDEETTEKTDVSNDVDVAYESDSEEGVESSETDGAGVKNEVLEKPTSAGWEESKPQNNVNTKAPPRRQQTRALGHAGLPKASRSARDSVEIESGSEIEGDIDQFPNSGHSSVNSMRSNRRRVPRKYVDPRLREDGKPWANREEKRAPPACVPAQSNASGVPTGSARKGRPSSQNFNSPNLRTNLQAGSLHKSPPVARVEEGIKDEWTWLRDSPLPRQQSRRSHLQGRRIRVSKPSYHETGFEAYSSEVDVEEISKPQPVMPASPVLPSPIRSRKTKRGYLPPAEADHAPYDDQRNPASRHLTTTDTLEQRKADRDRIPLSRTPGPPVSVPYRVSSMHNQNAHHDKPPPRKYDLRPPPSAPVIDLNDAERVEIETLYANSAKAKAEELGLGGDETYRLLQLLLMEEGRAVTDPIPPTYDAGEGPPDDSGTMDITSTISDIDSEVSSWIESYGETESSSGNTTPTSGTPVAAAYSTRSSGMSRVSVGQPVRERQPPIFGALSSGGQLRSARAVNIGQRQGVKEERSVRWAQKPEIRLYPRGPYQ
ncbi:hypothetical protein GALMADRAFT_142973 [Galerina marginata CBS 339.88]|uniref:Uncharacterized protein n=1 Tax=Galerina marginata (strain CBS 339.88) TaxID=685588 RepID=A0A067T0X3_GALM3|nr:hypothetical protein GALMADRAFT_142973 [Galerina marginata CBS 339.88]